MEEDPSPTHEQAIAAAICLDDTIYARYHNMLRHLCVGLIDIISSVRLVTTAEEAYALTLGPVQTVLHRELRWPMYARRFRRLAAELAAQPPTVVHAVSAGSFGVAERLAREFDAALVCQVTAVSDIRPLVRLRSDRLRRVICSSLPLLERYHEASGIERRDIALIRPGIACAAKPSCFADDERQPAILSTADLIAGAGVETLLQAVDLLHKRGHQPLTFLLGTGRDELRMRRRARELGLGSSVVFAHPEGELLRAMAGADIFVLPAVEDFVSVRSLQALGQGIAVVGIAGGVNDAYVPGKTAVLAPAPTASDMAAAIESLLSDHRLARTLATNAIEHVRGHHTMSTMAELTAQVYRSATRQHDT